MSGSPILTEPPPPVVVGTGLLALDVVLPFERTAHPKLWAGGTCGNVLLALSYMGWQVFPVARLGKDAAFDWVRDDLQRWGVRLDFIAADDDGSTPVIVHRIGRTSSGEAFHTFSKRCPYCGSILPGYKAPVSATAEGIIPRMERSQVFFFDRVSRAALILARACADKGALVVFEPSGLGTPELFGEALDVAHVVKYSHERMGEVEGLRSARKPLLKIETFGRNGLRYRSKLPGSKTNGWRTLKAFEVENVKDTAGAGDWCSVGLLHRLGQHGAEGFFETSSERLEEALVFGQALAAWTCRYEGARGGMYAVDRDQFLRDMEGIMDFVKHAPARDDQGDQVEQVRPCDFCSMCSCMA